MADKKILVYINLNGEDFLVGEMWSHFTNNKETSTFEYAPQWLANGWEIESIFIMGGKI